MRAWNKGHSWSEEQKKKLSKVHMGGKDGYNLALDIASLNRWKLLSNEYKNTHAKLEWECKKGHKFLMSLSKAQSGQDCSICSSGKSERLCRQLFEEIFGVKFPKSKPKWLSGWGGYRLELDGYNEQLGIAFEYQGEQHYKENMWFHKKRSFAEQVVYDHLKRGRCQENNVILIEIPYTVKLKNMRDYIIAEFKQKDIFKKRVIKE